MNELAKQLCPYLPYGLEGKFKHPELGEMNIVFIGIDINAGEILFHDLDEIEYLYEGQSPVIHRGFIQDSKPLMRSKLTDVELHIFGGKLEPYNSGDLITIANHWLNDMNPVEKMYSLNALDYLYSIHFAFDLDPNLYIDIS